MGVIAFTTSLSVNPAKPFAGRGLASRRPASASSAANLQMSGADLFQWHSQTKEAKQAATSSGVYTVQCTEGTSKSSDAESSRNAALAMNFRLRQASSFEKCRDLFATRRAAIVQSFNSHTIESYAVRFPARAAASVQGRAESLRTCSRYFTTTSSSADYLMFECVDRQYKAMKATNGEYSTMCADGRVQGDAETARVAALATQFRAGQFTTGQKTQMRYDAIREATMLGRGCEYEEAYYQKFPKCAAAMRYSSGAYAAGVADTSIATGGKKLSIDEQLKGANALAYWPSFLMRPAVENSLKKAWWKQTSNVKDYSVMSSGARAWGTVGQKSSYEYENAPVKSYNTWTPGWQPISTLALGPAE